MITINLTDIEATHLYHMIEDRKIEGEPAATVSRNNILRKILAAERENYDYSKIDPIHRLYEYFINRKVV